MSTKPCLFCGKPATQVGGRKPRKYCSDTCRQKDFHRKKKAVSDIEKMHPATKLYGQALGLIPPPEVALSQSIQWDPNKSFDMKEPMSVLVPDEPKKWQEAEVVKSELKLSTDPNTLKRMAEAGVSDLVAFKKHVASIKMTAGQRAMIYSKLK